jgi:hypothetical protein
VNDETTATSVPLAYGQALVLDRTHEPTTLQLRAADGQVALSIEITPAGPRLCFAGSVSVEVVGALALRADRIALDARDSLSLRTAGALDISAAGRADFTARAHRVVSTHGDVRLQANDDVRLNGERVLVNMPLENSLPVPRDGD